MSEVQDPSPNGRGGVQRARGGGGAGGGYGSRVKRGSDDEQGDTHDDPGTRPTSPGGGGVQGAPF